MEDNKLFDQYKEYIQETTIQDLKELCDKGEMDIKAEPNKIWVIDYLGEKPEEQANFLLNALVANDIAYMVEVNPSNLFEKVYAVKDYKGQQDIVAVFKDNAVDYDKLKDLYPETLKELTIANYLNTQMPVVGTYQKEEYDPLGFKEQQAKIDDVDAKLENGEITLGEALQELGLIGEDDYDKEKVIGVVEKLVNKEITGKDLKDMLANKEINTIELKVISDIIKAKYPEIDEELNKEIL